MMIRHPLCYDPVITRCLINFTRSLPNNGILIQWCALKPCRIDPCDVHVILRQVWIVELKPTHQLSLLPRHSTSSPNITRPLPNNSLWVDHSCRLSLYMLLWDPIQWAHLRIVHYRSDPRQCRSVQRARQTVAVKYFVSYWRLQTSSQPQ